MALLFKSFGYKYGALLDADYVFDVRCLPNPYWQAGLRANSGLDAKVQDFLNAQPAVLEMVETMANFLNTWLSSFAQNGRKYMTIAVGCTGGMHRSVYIVEKLAALFQENWAVQVRHRELS